MPTEVNPKLVKVSLKLNTSTGEFWERVYIAAVRRGCSTEQAALIADISVRDLEARTEE